MGKNGTMSETTSVRWIAPIVAMSAAVIGVSWIAADSGGLPADECAEDMEEIRERQRELIDELEVDAPTFDFEFPESCLDRE